MLISTKLQVPPLKSRMLSRENLVNRLSKGKDSRLITITGAAGSGKTSLACQWIEKEKLPVAWYSLDKTDNESDVFFRYLATALIDVDDSVASTIGPWLQNQKKLSGRDVILSIIQSLNDHPKEIYLILDDYHLIKSQGIHKILSYLLDYIPPKLHVVIISRSKISFSVAHFKVRNQIIEISAEDMQFTEKETEKYFTDIIPLRLSAQEIHKLAIYTEGWVGGLQLFGLSLRDKDTRHGLNNIINRAFHETTEYLIDDVISTQSRKVKDFLYVTALLERFNADICREITGLPDAQEILDYVYGNHLFLIPLNEERTWYRYHHLFSEALKKRMRRSSFDRASDIHKKAALWFAQKDYLEDAFRCAFASEDFEFTADLLEDHLFVLYERYEVASALRWLTKLPYEIFMQRTVLRLYECVFKIDSFQLLNIEAVARNIESCQTEAFERYKGSKRSLCADLLSYLKIVIPFYRESENADANKFDKTLQTISRKSVSHFGFIKDAIMCNYFVHSDPCFSDAVKKVSPMISSSDSVLSRIAWFKAISYAERLQGNLRRAEVFLKEAFEFLDRKGLSETPLKSILYSPIGWISYYRNDLDKAEEYGIIALKYGEQSGFVHNIIEPSVLLAVTYGISGCVEKANQYIRKLQQLLNVLDNPKLAQFVAATAARLYLSNGNIGQAEEWASQKKFDFDQPFSFRFAFECLTHAEILCRQGKYREISDTLEKLRSRCAGRNLMEHVLDVDLARSATFYALNQRDRAQTIMEQALAFADTEGYIRQFVNWAPMISSLLNYMATTPSNAGTAPYLKTIMENCGLGRDDVVNRHQPGEYGNGYLTQRETEILNLMVSGYSSYSEIAGKTFVSTETIRTHVKHIYKKLNVNTREQAIRRAEELGLLRDS